VSLQVYGYRTKSKLNGRLLELHELDAPPPPHTYATL